MLKTQICVTRPQCVVNFNASNISVVCHVQHVDNDSYITEQDGQCTSNVTLRRVRATFVAVEKQYLLHIVSVCL